MIVALVCMIMPFAVVTAKGVTETFSVYHLIAVFYKSTIGLTFSLTAKSVILSLKIFALVVVLVAAYGLFMLFNKNKSDKNSDNSRFTLIAVFCEIPLAFGLFYYFSYIIRVHAQADAEISMGIGAITMIVCFSLCILTLSLRFLKSRKIMAALVILVAIPLTIIFGMLFLGDRKYYIVSLLVIFETMLPFFMIFENRKPEPRELILIAVISAIAVVGRGVFFMLPEFKPVVAIVIIAGICLGAEAGFLTGALTGFVSNFFFGQGPWTPWQMFSFGIIGFLAGILFKKGWLSKKTAPLCIFGFFSALIIYGLLMDTCTILTSAFRTQQAIYTTYLAGFPMNMIHGIATAFFLWVLSKPMMEKLDRIKKKYGMMEP